MSIIAQRSDAHDPRYRSPFCRADARINTPCPNVGTRVVADEDTMHALLCEEHSSDFYRRHGAPGFRSYSIDEWRTVKRETIRTDADCFCFACFSLPWRFVQCGLKDTDPKKLAIEIERRDGLRLLLEFGPEQIERQIMPLFPKQDPELPPIGTSIAIDYIRMLQQLGELTRPIPPKELEATMRAHLSAQVEKAFRDFDIQEARRQATIPPLRQR